MPSLDRTERSIPFSDSILSQFSSDVASLHATPIAILEEAPTPLVFMREYVALSKPVLIRNNAFPLVTLDDIVEGNEDVNLHVDVTPDGHGDTIREVDGEPMFVMPSSKEMRLDEFRDGLRKQQIMMMNSKSCTTKKSRHIKYDDDGLQKFSRDNHDIGIDIGIGIDGDCDLASQDCPEILYYSRQNDCLRNELQPLTALFPPTISFAEEALNLKPDAVNLWIGNEASVSSMHKDHYENIMCVTAGEKVFTICPPSDALYLKEASFPSGTFRKQDRGTDNNTDYNTNTSIWTVDAEMVEDEEGKHPQMVRWLESDVERLLPPFSKIEQQSSLEQNPLLKHAHPMRVHVKAGEMLYLPSLWYHRVTQTCETVAVNYWYDMRFDSPGWCTFNLFQHINDDTRRTLHDSS
eukprot:scaffold307_cov238-Chaetoceros_neogracile.AAC.3